MKGTLEGVDVVLASIYAPNVNPAQFLMSLDGTLPDIIAGTWLLEGDYNMVLDVDIDRSLPLLRGE